MPTGRQGNLIVTSTNTVKDSELRQKFIEEIKKQGKPYGLYFEDIQGGFTLTRRASPQAFQVLPVMVYRVYADGRPDELVRGVDIVGTPLLSLNKIMVTGDTLQVFNGVCGAESGKCRFRRRPRRCCSPRSKCRSAAEARNARQFCLRRDLETRRSPRVRRCLPQLLQQLRRWPPNPQVRSHDFAPALDEQARSRALCRYAGDGIAVPHGGAEHRAFN